MARGLISQQEFRQRSPHARGDGPGYKDELVKLVQVVPTHVGMALLGLVALYFAWSSPHARGDGPAGLTDMPSVFA